MNRTGHPRLERPYESWCSGHRASGRSPDLQTPFFGPGSVLVGSDDGGVDDQIFEVRIIGHRLEDPPPNTLEAPPTEATEIHCSNPRTLPADHARESPYARSKARLPRTSGCRARSSLSGQDVFEGVSQIPLMTVHKSKGLEYDTIVFVGLDDQAWCSHTPWNPECLAP